MAKRQRRVGEARDEVLAAVPFACTDERAAVELFEQIRWGDEPYCPTVGCGSTDVYQMHDRKTGDRQENFRWRCRSCKRQYTVRTNTVYECSRIPMSIWAHIYWRASSSKTGVSALQISRETGLSYKSALHAMHRIRVAMGREDSTPSKLSGTVEADETYLGGRPRYRIPYSDPNRLEKLRARGDRKVPVVAVVERGGEVRASSIANVNKDNIARYLRDSVDSENTKLITDESPLYTKIGREFARGHETVNHGRREYVRGNVHTNTIEGFFSILKRGIHGSYFAVSKKHLPKYINEFEHRYNTRHMTDGERIAATIRQSEGKRLRYQDQRA